jgi:gelsolin
VTPNAESLNKGDVFVLDRGNNILQLNTRASSGKEKFAAAEFVRNLVTRGAAKPR